MAGQDKEIDDITRRLQSVELRLSKIESLLNRNKPGNSITTPDHSLINGQAFNAASESEEDKGIESQIGRFGLPWLGNIVLLFGIIFLTQYLMDQGYRYSSVILGYVGAAAIFFVSKYVTKNNGHLAFTLLTNAQVLLFYITAKLHFFSSSPLISNKLVSVAILLILVAFQSCLSVSYRSQTFAALSILFALATAIICNTTHLTLAIVALTAAMALYYLYRFDWRPLLVVTIFLSYIALFNCIFGNPIMNLPMQLIALQRFGVIYLFSLGGFYSASLLFRKQDKSSDDFLVGVTFTNGILFTIMLLAFVLGYFSTGYVGLFMGIAACCLGYSIILHSRSGWNFASAFYALYGFMAMSIALYGLVGLPDVYLLLSLQSLLVVSIALWFRNRQIVIMNSLLFLALLIIYLFSSKPVDGVNFSFAMTSLMSARIINWKRARLQIKAGLIRNLYLIEGFIMVLLSLLHAVPRNFVTLSWTMAALLYFFLSFVLKNVKYRYMALGTMICAAFYLFIIDLARMGIVYRVLALLFLAAISIGISIYYSNRMKKRSG